MTSPDGRVLTSQEGHDYHQEARTSFLLQQAEANHLQSQSDYAQQHAERKFYQGKTESFDQRGTFLSTAT